MIALLICLVLAVSIVVLGVYAERKVSAFIQDRMGPMEVGPYGSLQLIADLIKLLQKEDIVPTAADRKLFLLAPALVFISVFAGYAVLPLSPDLQSSTTEVGVFFLLSIIALDILGILMAGWASNNKYSLFGAMRTAAQVVSYEIPLGLSVLCVVMISQSLDLQQISYQQGVYAGEPIYLFGIKSWGLDVSHIGGVFSWNLFKVPFLFIVFVIYFLASLAECNRAPFDIPEAESELVGGFHTEYSGFRWAILFLSEYAMMLLMCLLGAILFLGGWNTPLPNIGPIRLADWSSGTPGTLWGDVTGLFWLLAKGYSLIFVQMWIRWTYPRLRVDQLMYLCWKVLTPAGLILLFLSGIWRLLMV
ncbi:MAG: NADH-quinone oxidoreductase subunit NuoH [Spirosomataceae bacterium]